MIIFEAAIKKFREKGEKSGWTYFEIPLDIAEKLNPDNKKAFRVKGKLDGYYFSGLSLIPMGEGNYIMALNKAIRKAIGKDQGDELRVELEKDTEEKPLNTLFMECLCLDQSAHEYFITLPKSHQRYFSNWIESAKTEATREKRLSMAIRALSMKMGFPEMIRSHKANKE